jgi:hypothetical protein
MIPLLFAQAFALGYWAIVLIFVAAVVAICITIINWRGVTIPAPIVNILWIVLAAVVGILAIRFLLGFV